MFYSSNTRPLPVSVSVSVSISITVFLVWLYSHLADFQLCWGHLPCHAVPCLAGLTMFAQCLDMVMVTKAKTFAVSTCRKNSKVPLDLQL